jgi:hypothetical protein
MAKEGTLTLGKLSVGLKVEVKSILLLFTVPVIPSCDNLMEKYEIQHV